LLAARGDPSAIEILQDTFSAAVAGPAAVVQMRSGPELAIQLAQHGRRDEAEAVVQRCRELLASGEDWRGRAGRVVLAEAAIAYAGGRLEEADERFEAALDVFQRYSLPWDEAEAHHLRGRLLARLGKQQRPQAAGSFDAAAEIYRRIDAARPWLDALAASRSVSFGRATQAREGYPGGLSEREAEVLRLIAQGRSNREISEALVLSVRTVERHITNIYAKIGARGKADATAYALRHGLS
jgi:DNA-binding CsgD family transcriptional regulator